jgi:hypothetical protein
MLRLLYLLARQQVRHMPRKAARPASPSDVAAAVRNRRRRTLTLGLAALAACGAIAALISVAPPRFMISPFERPGGETGTLQVHVGSAPSVPVVIFLQGLESAEEERAEAVARTARLISVGNAFQPMFQVAPLASSIDVGNDDPIPHNTHVFNGQRTLFNVATPVPGVRVRKVLTRAGIFDVRCDLHAWMRAWIFVPPTAHYAVLSGPGRAAIENIPAGSYRLHVWEPAAGEQVRTLALAPGEKKTLSWPER